LSYCITILQYWFGKYKYPI